VRPPRRPQPAKARDNEKTWKNLKPQRHKEHKVPRRAPSLVRHRSSYRAAGTPIPRTIAIPAMDWDAVVLGYWTVRRQPQDRRTRPPALARRVCVQVLIQFWMHWRFHRPSGVRGVDAGRPDRFQPAPHH
jgi:hypothetical protein